MVAPKTVVVRQNLYDTYPDTGYRFLAHAVGEEIPLAEFERLAAQNPASAIEEIPAEPEKPAKSPIEQLEDMNKAQLLVRAAELGIEGLTPRSKVDEIRDAVRAELEKPQDADGTEGDDDQSDGGTDDGDQAGDDDDQSDGEKGGE